MNFINYAHPSQYNYLADISDFFDEIEYDDGIYRLAFVLYCKMQM